MATDELQADAQPYRGAPGSRDLIPYHRELANQLAMQTGDAKLARLIELAIVVDASEWSWKGGRLATPVERYESRASRWRRVWAHLAGEPDVLIMGTRARRREDDAVWIFAEFRHGPTEHPGDGIWPIDAGFPTIGSENRRGAPIPRAIASEYANIASELAGRVSSYVAVGFFGDVTPVHEWYIPVPPGKQEARRAVRTQLAAAAVAARNLGGHPGRMRLDQYLRHLVAYLLHHGHGALVGVGWRRAVQLFFGWDTPLPTGEEDCSEARTVRAHDAAACRLIGIGGEPGWRRIG